MERATEEQEEEFNPLAGVVECRDDPACLVVTSRYLRYADISLSGLPHEFLLSTAFDRERFVRDYYDSHASREEALKTLEHRVGALMTLEQVRPVDALHRLPQSTYNTCGLLKLTEDLTCYSRPEGSSSSSGGEVELLGGPGTKVTQLRKGLDVIFDAVKSMGHRTFIVIDSDKADRDSQHVREHPPQAQFLYRCLLPRPVFSTINYCDVRGVQLEALSCSSAGWVRVWIQTPSSAFSAGPSVVVTRALPALIGPVLPPPAPVHVPAPVTHTAKQQALSPPQSPLLMSLPLSPVRAGPAGAGQKKGGRSRTIVGSPGLRARKQSQSSPRERDSV